MFNSMFSGSGDKLGDIPRVNFQINKIKPADLKPLHAILFDRPGKVQTSGPCSRNILMQLSSYHMKM